jgi:hypothetical protein
MASGLMLRLAELKLPLDHTEEELTQAVLRRLKIPPDQLLEQRLVKRSIDARRRDRIQLIYSVDVLVRHEQALMKRRRPGPPAETGTGYPLPDGGAGAAGPGGTPRGGWCRPLRLFRCVAAGANGV